MKKIIIEIDLEWASDRAIEELLWDDGSIEQLVNTWCFMFTEKTEHFKTDITTYKVQSVVIV